MKKLSIIVPAYNIEKYMDECISSFIECVDVLEHIEIIIVNDGSTDSTAEMAANYQKEYPNTIKVVNKENGGHGSAINSGMNNAEGIYVKVVDGDDWVLKEGLVELVDYIGKLTNEVNMPDMIINPFEIVYENDNKTERVGFDEFATLQSYSIADIITRKRNLEMHAITFKTEVYKKNKIVIDENMFYVDTEYILFPIPYIQRIVFLNNVIYQYRIGNVGQSVSSTNMQKRRNMHKNVIMSLLRYYKENENAFDECQKKYYLYRTAMMTTAQANVYCTMEDTQNAKMEMIEFVKEYDRYKKENGIDRKVDWKINKKIPFLRVTGFLFFKQVSEYYRRKNKMI